MTVSIDEQTQLFAALKRLHPSIAAYVTEHNPKTLEEILKFARIAELTRNPALCRQEYQKTAGQTHGVNFFRECTNGE